MVTTEATGRASCPQCRAVFRGGFARCPHDGTTLSTEDRDPLVGTVLAERYQIESVIGEGGIGRVYRARHVRMSRRYAIKVPFGELAYDAKVRARFLQEAEATSRLTHPNVIGVVDVGETSAGLLYMAMDLAEGTSLSQVLADEGPLPRPRVLRIVEQTAAALGHAHDRGLIHRDLKPENVILERAPDGSDRVRIVDFGIAIIRDAEGHSGRLTTEGIVLGTPHYMSPEQACNLDIDHRTDLFALGLITYEMLAGVLPFDGTPIEVARKNLAAEPPRITQRVPGIVVDQYLEALAFWLMRKRPEERPQHADEVIDTIRLIELDPIGAAARLRIGEVEEVDEMGVAPVVKGLPAPKPAIRPRTPLPPREVKPPTPPQLAAAEPTQPLRDTPAARSPAARSIDRDEPTPPRRRGALVLALVVGLLALGGLIALVLTRSPAPTEAARTIAIDAAPAGPVVVAVAAVADAAVVAPVDAQVGVEVAAPDAAPAPVRTPRSSHDNRAPKNPRPATAPRIDAGTKRVVSPPSTEPPTTASLSALYTQVGRQLNALVAARGEQAALGFKKRYGAIPYLEAIRKADLRAEAMARLRALSRDLADAL